MSCQYHEAIEVRLRQIEEALRNRGDNGYVRHIEMTVWKREMDDMNEKLLKTNELLNKVSERLQVLEEDKKTGASIRQFWAPVIVGLITLAGTLLTQLIK